MRFGFRFSIWLGTLSALVLSSAPGLAQVSAPAPTTVEAKEIRGTPDQQTIAEGNAVLTQEGTTVRADMITYDRPSGIARAIGNVEVLKNGDVYRGPLLQLQVETYEGFFSNPTYVLGRNGAMGSAQRIDFLDKYRAVGTQGTYSTCTPGDDAQVGWMLSARRLTVDYEKNEGVAEGAVLRFLGVPILAAPVLSFPLTSERKSGWLPPSIEVDSSSGLQLSVPYYWNIAPHMDATLAPELSLRRGTGLNTEFRYLQPDYKGTIDLNWLPHDKVADSSRYRLNLNHGARVDDNTQVNLQLIRVSDNDYWKDFQRDRDLIGLTPRLLNSNLDARHVGADWTTYAKVQSWQVLQSLVPGEGIDAPYQRTPQIGARTQQFLGRNLRLDFETEFNQFSRPVGASSAQYPTGSRIHSLASLSYPWVSPAWSLTPKISLNAATYALDTPLMAGPHAGQKSVTRIIPTTSLDSSWVLERDSQWFGRSIRQTLEPRLVYSYTPFHDQTGLPNFDSAPKDFTFESIYSADNAFTGVDRVADAHQVTASISTRLIDPATGAEALRLGLAQRYLLRDQWVTPDGVPLTQRLSDVFVMGSTSVIPQWSLNATLQYNAELARVQRSAWGGAYSPGPFRTLSASYNTDHVANTEQVSMGWQWPLYGPLNRTAEPLVSAAPSTSSACCQGAWYSVGRVNYNTRDRTVVDAIMGLEYDAGCWIGRVVARRLSTGLNESVTGIGFQLELVGLSRLGFGSNPVQVLKENVGGYRPLRN